MEDAGIGGAVMYAEVCRNWWRLLYAYFGRLDPLARAPAIFIAMDGERVCLHDPATQAMTGPLHFLWRDVSRICFRSELSGWREGFYVFTSGAERCFIIPICISGCTAFYEHARARGLFPDDLALSAFTASKPAWFCWPSHGHDRGSSFAAGG